MGKEDWEKREGKEEERDDRGRTSVEEGREFADALACCSAVEVRCAALLFGGRQPAGSWRRGDGYEQGGGSIGSRTADACESPPRFTFLHNRKSVVIVVITTFGQTGF